MSSQIVLSDILASIVSKKVLNESYGVLLKDLPSFSYTHFLESLELKIREYSLTQPNIFFVGFSNDEINELKASIAKQLCLLPLYYSVEEAEDFRNNGDETGTRIVIVKRMTPKLSSLQWYEMISADVIYKEICKSAEKQIGGINDYLKNIWRALDFKKMRDIISLERLIDYYQQLIIDDDDIPKQSIEQLFRLGLLIDDSLFINSSIDAIRKRIINNWNLVSRIGNLNSDKEDMRILQSNFDSEKYYSIRANVLKFYGTRELSVLRKMKYQEVLELFSRVKKDKIKKKKGNNIEDYDSNENIFTKKKPDSPEAAAVNLLLEHETEKVQEIIEEIDNKYNEWEKGKRSREKVDNSSDNNIQIEFIPEIHTLVETFVGENAYGGVIRANVRNPTDALRSLGQFKVQTFDNDYIQHIKEVIQTFEEEFNEVKGLLNNFNSFLQIRSSLVSAAHRLADCPMLKIVETEELMNNCMSYMDIYSKILKQVKEHYSLFSSFSPRGSKQLVANLNSIDMIYIIGDDNIHATMTPLYPLHLWKYIELTARLRESSPNLNEIDKDFLLRKSDEIPNPLPTSFISNFISNQGDTVIPEVGALGKLPLYSSEQQVNQAIDGLQLIENSLIKLMKVYPHSSFGVRVAFVNPPSVKHVLDIYKRLLQNKDINFEGAHIHIYKTKETPENWASFDAVDDTIHSRFALSNDSNFSIKIDTTVISFKGLVDSIKRHPFHAVVIFDPCGKAITNTRRNPLLKIHPLCIPKVFEYDPIYDRVEILPASDGNIFSDHHDLIARLNDKPQGWHHTVVLELETSKEEFEQILNSTQWLIIADENLKNLEFSVIGSDKCIFYQSKAFRDIGIYTNDWTKLTRGMDRSIRSIGNYDPKEQCVTRVLRTIQGLNEKGVLQLASSRVDKTFNLSHTKGALGTAISAIWSKQYLKNHILVSLDTDLSQNWLDERDNGAFSDLLGINFNENQASIDIIEVKTYDGAYQVSQGEISGKAIDQINSVRQIINEIFSERDKITSTSRKELLRFQVFRAFYQLPLTRAEKKEWTYQLNRLFAGEIPVNVNSYIHHVRFSELGTTTNNQFDSNYKISLVEIRDDFINQVLVNCSGLQLENDFGSIGSKRDRTDNQNEFKIELNVDSLNISEKGELNSSLSSEQQINLSTQGFLKDPFIDSSETDNESLNASTDLATIEVARKTAGDLFQALRDYSIDVSAVDPDMALIASRFIRYRVRLRPGETLQKLQRYRTDISREIEAEADILVGNERGTQFVYVDVPRKNSDSIELLEHLSMLSNEEPVGNLNVVIGQEPNGEFKLLNIAQAPHLLTAGSTGSGKTIFLYSLIVSLIAQYTHESLELVIIDPKQTDFIFFEGLPHLRNGEVILDAEQAVAILTDLTENELERRTEQLRKSRSRDLFSYNQKNPDTPLKPIVVIIDEYADLVQVADMENRKKDFERQMIRLAQRSRNVGIHLVVATQRPSADIVTSNLKTNIPCRVSFRLPAHQDSMTILDSPGAEDLLGKGDMLFSLNGEITRLQGLYISEEDLESFLKKYI
ncbi:FtsK/SpoIIIE domain-containing protein [Paenibacillus sp. G2S3]|uniref:FtsK/SpoIIIE domain-containing protein n=1 Tax=Paenibacillus sp. G2S3 TaxID=3047872 RepID=UPI0024C1BB73|nr:FtsK/SpoIIIE domain-containing protein [Paenibacillus sp. G2S3]WHY20112.1 FtsK/SpoIIIE domain-containing protein [Paenibacillus sp. G2S3]